MSAATLAAAPGVAHARAWRGLPALLAAIVGVLALSTLVPEQGYTLNIVMQAATYAVAVAGLVVVLGYCGQISLAQAAFFGLGAYGVALGTADYGLPFFVALILGVASGGCVRRGARPGQPAARRALPRHGHHQLPADPDAGADQLVRADARAGRGEEHRAAQRAGPAARKRRPLSGAVPRRAHGRHLVHLAAEDDPARPRHAGGARQRDRGQHLRHRHLRHQGAGVRHQRRAGRSGRRAVRRRVLLHQPGPVRLRRKHRAADHGAAGRGAVAVRGAARHRAAGDPAGMAALPAPGLPCGVRRRRHPHHGVPSGRLWGLTHRLRRPAPVGAGAVAPLPLLGQRGADTAEVAMAIEALPSISAASRRWTAWTWRCAAARCTR